MRCYSYRGYSWYKKYNSDWYVYSSYERNKDKEIVPKGNLIGRCFSGKCCKDLIVAIYALKSMCRK